jgi:hypothetical protein
MKTQSIDTHPKTERILISLLKQESTAKKFSQIRSLSQMSIQLSKRAISRVNKELDENQINLLFINYHYGKDLAERVRKYLKLDCHENP